MREVVEPHDTAEEPWKSRVGKGIERTGKNVGSRRDGVGLGEHQKGKGSMRKGRRASYQATGTRNGNLSVTFALAGFLDLHAGPDYHWGFAICAIYSAQA